MCLFCDLTGMLADVFLVLFSEPQKYGTNQKGTTVFYAYKMYKNAFESLSCLLCTNLGIAKSFRAVLQKIGFG